MSPPHLLNIGLTISLGAFDLYACRSVCCGLTNCQHLLLTAVSHRHSHCLLPLLWSFLHLCLSLTPTHLLEQASPLGLKHMHTSSPDLLCTEFPSDVTCSPLRCSPPHFTPHLAPAERIASPRWGNRGECGLSISH